MAGMLRWYYVAACGQSDDSAAINQCERKCMKRVEARSGHLRLHYDQCSPQGRYVQKDQFFGSVASPIRYRQGNVTCPVLDSITHFGSSMVLPILH
jgi:hypothetical protein